jgi:hypothetical protein
MACPCFFGLLHDALDFGIDSRDCRSRGTLCVEDRAAEITRRGGGPRGGIDRRRARSAGVVTRQVESVWRSDDSQRGSGARSLVCGR